MFPGPITFDAPWASLRFEARLLDLPLARDETALQQMLQRALPIQVLPYRRERQWSTRVRQLLVADTQLLHTADTLARALLEAGDLLDHSDGLLAQVRDIDADAEHVVHASHQIVPGFVERRCGLGIRRHIPGLHGG